MQTVNLNSQVVLARACKRLEKYHDAYRIYEKMMRLIPEIRQVTVKLYPECLKKLENSISGDPNIIIPGTGFRHHIKLLPSLPVDADISRGH